MDERLCRILIAVLAALIALCMVWIAWLLARPLPPPAFFANAALV